MLRAYILLPCFIALVAGCGAGADLATGGSTASGGSTTTSTTGSPVPCGSISCAPDEYCFTPWYCDTCGDTCPCVCAPLPASCPESSPCSCPAGGYYGNPSEVFDGGATPYPDHQVSCYGS